MTTSVHPRHLTTTGLLNTLASALEGKNLGESGDAPQNTLRKTLHKWPPPRRLWSTKAPTSGLRRGKSGGGCGHLPRSWKRWVSRPCLTRHGHTVSSMKANHWYGTYCPLNEDNSLVRYLMPNSEDLYGRSPGNGRAGTKWSSLQLEPKCQA